MADTRVSPLRQRMIEDMTMRNFAPRTQEGYIRAARAFAAFLGRSPGEASFEDVRRFQLHLVSSGAGVPTVNHALTALRFLFTVTLRKPEVVVHLPFIKEPRRLPVVLSPEEVARLLDAAPGLKYKAALSVAYGAGLRASEIISLKIADIDSTRMVIRVEQGKAHLLEQKIDIRVIQVLLGHKKLDTTALYTRVALKSLGEVTSPLEHLVMTVTPPA